MSELVLLLTTTRVAPGLMSRSAWQALEGADVLAQDADDPTPAALADQGVLHKDVELIEKPFSPAELLSRVRRALDAVTADGAV